MAETVLETADSTPFQAMFIISALKLYEKRTKKDLITSTGLQLQACDTLTAILTIRQEQAREFDQAFHLIYV